MIAEEVAIYIVKDSSGRIDPVASARKAMRAGLGKRGGYIVFDEAMRMINDGKQVSIGDQEAIKDLQRRGYTPPVRDPDTGMLGQQLSPRNMRRSRGYNRRTGKYKDPQRENKMDAGKYANTEMRPPHDFVMDPLQVEGYNPVPLDGGSAEAVIPEHQHGPYGVTAETGRHPIQTNLTVTPSAEFYSGQTGAPPPQAQHGPFGFTPETGERVDMPPLQVEIPRAAPAPVASRPLQTETMVTPSAEFYSQQTAAPPPLTDHGPYPMTAETGERVDMPPLPVVIPNPLSAEPVPTMTEEEYYAGQSTAPIETETVITPSPEFYSRQTMAPPPGPVQSFQETPASEHTMAPMGINIPNPTPMGGQTAAPPMPPQQSLRETPASRHVMEPMNIGLPNPVSVDGQTPAGAADLAVEAMSMRRDNPLSFNMAENLETVPFDMRPKDTSFNMAENLEHRYPHEEVNEEILREVMSAAPRTDDPLTGAVFDGTMDVTDLVSIQHGGAARNKIKQEALRRKLQFPEKMVKSQHDPETGVTRGPRTSKEDVEMMRNEGRGAAVSLEDIKIKGKKGGPYKSSGKKTMGEFKTAPKTDPNIEKAKKNNDPKEAGRYLAQNAIEEMATRDGEKWAGFIPALKAGIEQLERIAGGEDPYQLAAQSILAARGSNLADTEMSAKMRAAQMESGKTGKYAAEAGKAALKGADITSKAKDAKAIRRGASGTINFQGMEGGQLVAYGKDKSNLRYMEKHPHVRAAYAIEVERRKKQIAASKPKKLTKEQKQLQDLTIEGRELSNAEKRKKLNRKPKPPKKAKLKAIGTSADQARQTYLGKWKSALNSYKAKHVQDKGNQEIEAIIDKHEELLDEYVALRNQHPEGDQKDRPAAINNKLKTLAEKGKKILGELRTATRNPVPSPKG